MKQHYIRNFIVMKINMDCSPSLLYIAVATKNDCNSVVHVTGCPANVEDIKHGAHAGAD